MSDATREIPKSHRATRLLANVPKVEHRIQRIGLSFETLQQHSSFRPTSAQLGKSLKGPECIRSMLLQFWRRDKFPAIHHPRDFPSGKVPSIAFE
jgi:hypothetical protein